MRGFLKISTVYSSISMTMKVSAAAFAVYAAQNNLISVAAVYLIITYIVWTFETAMQRDLYARCFSKLTNQTLFFHSNKFGGSLVSQTNKLVGAVERFWDTIIWSILPLIISLVGSIIILSTLLWQYALFLLIFSIVFTLVVCESHFIHRNFAVCNF
jgi:ATP-binding cassette, subfamily B, bacterial